MNTPRRHPIEQAISSMYRGLARCSLLLPALAAANPSGETVVSGEVSFSNPDANTLQVDQNSDSAIVNWQSFSVGSDEFVVFNQPSASAAILNRVIGGDLSTILGSISGNGRVFLVNPMGVLFGEGAQIDVGALVATTLDIQDNDFSNGNYAFAGSGDASVDNQGTIRTSPGGFVVLAAPQVLQSGTIEAASGNVLLAAADGLTLFTDADGLVGYEITAAAVSEATGIENLGQIAAAGGVIALDAATTNGLMATVVNNRGLITAASIDTGPDGEIILAADGGSIAHGGTLDAGAADGGFVDMRSSGGITGVTTVDPNTGEPTVETGDILAGEVSVEAVGDIQLRDITSASSRVVIRTEAGSISVRDVTMTHSGSGGGSISMSAGGDLSFDTLTQTIDGSGGSIALSAGGAITGANISQAVFVGNGFRGGFIAMSAGGNLGFDTLTQTIDGSGGSIALSAGGAITGAGVSQAVNAGADHGVGLISMAAGGDLGFDTLTQTIDGSGGGIAFSSARGAITVAGISQAVSNTAGLTVASSISAFASGSGSIAIASIDASAVTSGAGSVESAPAAFADVFARTTGGAVQIDTLTLNADAETGFSEALADIGTGAGDMILGEVTLSARTGSGSSAAARLRLNSEVGGDIAVGSITVSSELQDGGLGTGGGSLIKATQPSYGGYGGYSSIDIFSYGGNVSVGNVTVTATATNASDAYAGLFVRGFGSGDLGIGSAVIQATQSASAPNSGVATARMSMDNSAGAVSIGAADLSAQQLGSGDGGGFADVDLSLQSNNLVIAGDLTVTADGGNLGAGQGQITASGQALELGAIALDVDGGAEAFSTSGSVQLSAGLGDIGLDAIDVDVLNGSANVFASAGGDLTIDGRLDVIGGGSSNAAPGLNKQFDSTEPQGVANVSLNAGGTVTVGEGISLTARETRFSSSFSDGSFTATGGAASLNIYADAVEIGSQGLTLDAIGHGVVDIYAENRVSITGDTRVDVIAEQLLDRFGGSSLVQHDGIADVHIGTYTGFANPEQNTSLSLGNLAITGPNAVLMLASDTIDTGNVTVSAPADSVLFEETQDGVVVLTTDLGVAFFEAYSDAEPGAGHINIGGSLAVTGPTAGARLASFGDITVQGDIHIAASGYSGAGSFGDDSYGAYGSGYGGSHGQPVAVGLFPLLPPDMLPPPLDQGQIHWGGASLQIGAPFQSICVECGPAAKHLGSGAADSVTINGELRLTGKGAVSAELRARNLSAGNVVIDAASQGYGEIQGQFVERSVFIESPSGSGFYDVTHTIGDGQGGAAQSSVAELLIELGDSGSASVGDVTVSGATALFEVEGHNASLTAQNVNVSGSAASGAPAIYVDTRQYAGTSGAPALADTTNAVTGDFHLFAAGFDSDAAMASISTGNITVSGHGLAAVALQAGAIALGDVRVDAQSGAFDLNDPRFALTGAGELAGALLLVQALGEVPASAGTIELVSTGEASLNAQLDSRGGVSVSAARIGDTIPAIAIDFQHPLDALLFGYEGGGGALPALAGNTVHAAGDIALTAAESLDIDEASFNAGAQLSLTAPSLSIGSNLNLSGSGITLTATSGDLGLIGATLGGAVSLTAGGAIEIDGARLNDAAQSAPTGSVTASAQSIEILNDSLIGGAVIDLNASDSMRIDASLLHGTQTTLTAGGALNLIDGFLAGRNLSLNATSLLLSGSEIGRGELTQADTLHIEAETLDASRGNLLAETQTIDAAEVTFSDLALIGSNRIDINATNLSLDTVALSAGDASLSASGALSLVDGSELAAVDTLALTGGHFLAADSIVRGNRVSANVDTLDSVGNDWLADTLELDATGMTLDEDLLQGAQIQLAASDTLSINDTTAVATTAIRAVAGTLSVTGGSGLGAGSSISLEALGGDLLLSGSSVFGTGNATATIDLISAGAVLLENALIRGGAVNVSAPSPAPLARALSATDRDAGPGHVIADEGTRIDAISLSVEAGQAIDLSRARVQVGTGQAGFGNDARLLERLGVGNADLRPVSPGPNAAFRAPTLRLGALGMAGDYLFIQGNAIELGGPVDAPAGLFVNLRPIDPAGSIGIEAANASGQALNLFAPGFLNLPATATLAFGGGDASGNVVIGNNGPVDLSESRLNLVFLSSGEIIGSDRIRTGGRIVLLDRVSSITDREPQVQEFQPSQNDEVSPSGESGSDTGEEDDDDSRDRDDRAASGDTGSRSGERYVSEESSAEVALECS